MLTCEKGGRVPLEEQESVCTGNDNGKVACRALYSKRKDHYVREIGEIKE